LRSGFSIHGAGDVDDDYQMARLEGFEPPPSDPKLSHTVISMYQQQAKFNA